MKMMRQGGNTDKNRNNNKYVWAFRDEHFGPLLPYVKDLQITDINFNGRDVYVEHLDKGAYKLDLTLDPHFVDQFAVRVSNVVSEQFNRYHNVLEAETENPDLRISVIHHTVTNTGTSISIRKTPAVMRLHAQKMLSDRYITREALDFLHACMRVRMNIVFCGTPGAGKTELLKYLTQFIPHTDKVMTIEDNLEIRYSKINPRSNCVELKVDEQVLTYTAAIKAVLKQNPQWVLLSEARSTEVKYLLECFSTGLHGMTTLHTDDARKIPDRIQNMMSDAFSASRAENDIYGFVNVGVLLKKKFSKDRITRYVDQVCIFDRVDGQNQKRLLVDDGKVTSCELTENIAARFRQAGVKNPLEIISEGAHRR